MIAVVAELPATYAWAIPAVVIGIVFSFFWNSVISICLYRLSKSDHNVEQLEKRLTEANEIRVNERFDSLSRKLDEHVDNVSGELDKLTDRVKERGDTFEQIARSKTELMIAKELSELRQEVRESTVSQKAFDELKEEHRDLREQVARIGTLDDMRKLLNDFVRARGNS